MDHRPQIMHATIGYPRLYQGWGMFAPNPITDDGTVVVDAHTIDGRRIDPFTGKEPDLDLTHARGLGLGQIQQDYFNRIRLDQNKVYRQGLSEYLRALAPPHRPPRGRARGVRRLLGPRPVPAPRREQALRQRDHPHPHVAQARLQTPAGAPPIPPEPKVEERRDAAAPRTAEAAATFFGYKLPSFGSELSGRASAP